MNELQDGETKGWKLHNFLFLPRVFLFEAILKHALSSPHFTWQANKEMNSCEIVILIAIFLFLNYCSVLQSFLFVKPHKILQRLKCLLC